jgi:hypothetical protein
MKEHELKINQQNVCVFLKSCSQNEKLLDFFLNN